MRILIWCGVFSEGGGGRLLLNLIPAIARQPDIELVRVVAATGTGLKERMAGKIPSNVEVIYFDHDIVRGQRFAGDCHVVYYFWPHSLPYQFFNRPTICTFHDATVLDFVPPFLNGSQIREYWERANAWLTHTTAVVVSSHHSKNRLIDHFGPSMERCEVIPHAISTIRTHEQSVLRPEMAGNLPAEYIVYPSNTSPHKNHYNLLLAYARFSQRKKYPLVLFGHLTESLRYQAPNWPAPAFMPTLVSLVKRLGFRPDIDYFPLGFVKDSDVPAIIRNAKALIMPSLSEGGGSYPVEEALRLGTPVLCSDIPVMREHLADRTARIAWFDPESPNSIAEALEQMVNHYESYKSTTLQGMGDPHQTWDDVAAQYIRTFRQAYLKFYGIA